MDLDVLITAIPGDMHAAAVSVALEGKGCMWGVGIPWHTRVRTRYRSRSRSVPFLV
jgi:hypothetical protein